MKNRIKIRVYIRRNNQPLDDYCGYYDICDCRKDSEAKLLGSIAYRRRDGRYQLSRIANALTGAIGENAFSATVFFEEGKLKFAESDEDYPKNMNIRECVHTGSYTVYIENLETLM